MAHSVLACFRCGSGPLVPWSPGLLFRWSLVAALGRLRVMHKAAFGAFERLGLMQMTTFAVLDML